MADRRLQEQLDPITPEDMAAWEGNQQFPVKPGNWTAQLGKDVQNEYLPSAGDNEQQSIFKIMQALSMMMPGGRPTGPGTSGVFGSWHALEARAPKQSNLLVNTARAGLKAGVSPQEVWNKLGISFGADHLPRIELGPATSSELLDQMNRAFMAAGPRKMQEIPLGAVLNKDISRTYPHLENMPLILRPTFERGGSEAAYNPSGDRHIWMTLGDRTYSPPAPTLEHEVQHAIQQIEGLNRGGSPFEFRHPVAYPKKSMSTLYKTLLNVLGPDETKKWFLEPGDANSLKNYFRLAGEVEARNAERRFTRPELRRIEPSKTEDIPRTLQRVRISDPYE